MKAAKEIETEEELAALYARGENKFWWAEDEEYDFEEGTEDHKRAVENAHFWSALADKLREQIFEILRAEGVEIPAAGQIVVLKSFMKRNGFLDGHGWWIKA